MATYAALDAGNVPETQSSSESESDGEDLTVDAPSMEEYMSARAQLSELNGTRKELMETLKRKRDELEQYMLEKETKYLRLDGMVAQIKTCKKIPWNEKSLREHVDEDGKVDLDTYKSTQTTIVEKMTIKLQD